MNSRGHTVLHQGDRRGRPLLEVDRLSVDLRVRSESFRALDALSFSLAEGEILGLVGESGAGKSLAGAALTGLLPPGAHCTAGSIRLGGRRLDDLPEREWQTLRGRDIGAIFQDPMAALNPLYTVGQQLIQTLRAHRDLDRAQAREQALACLLEVGLSQPERRLNQYPHELSGGMRQRVVIALALAPRPRLIIADEPTTALDVSVQAQVLALIRNLARSHGTAVVLVTHDMGVVAALCDRVAVMYAGRLVETGPVGQVLQMPAHPYTRGLMAANPGVHQSRERLVQLDGFMPRLDDRPVGCAFHPRCPQAGTACLEPPPHRSTLAGAGDVACWFPRESVADPIPVPVRAPDGWRPVVAGSAVESVPVLSARNIGKSFRIRPGGLWTGWRRGGEEVRAVAEFSLDIRAGKTVGLVGESGCGKSTVARMLAGLCPPDGGEVLVEGQPWYATLAREPGGLLRRQVQMVFQDPMGSLDPRWTVDRIVAEPLLATRRRHSRQDLAETVAATLARVGLSADDARRFSHQFSGGQRQRIAIARALITEPALLICDEPTSALDVSVQAQVLNLMKDLQQERGMAYLFISHNLAVVRHMADEVGVMYQGRLVEHGPAATVLAHPAHPYTRMLLDAVPDPAVPGGLRCFTATPDSSSTAPAAVFQGCAYQWRCPHAQGRCHEERPLLLPAVGRGRVACHAVQEGRLSG